MTDPNASILIAAYNKEDLLARTLLALERQSFRNFEVIICDDGSGPAIAKTIDTITGQVSYAIRHIRHEDIGFRKCKILNRGVLLSRADYIIVLDPDCIPHRHFVKGHLEERKPGYFLAGRRLMIGPLLSGQIQENGMDWRRLESMPQLALHWLRFGGGRHLAAGIYLPGFARKIIDNRQLALKGCNMSFWKKDLEENNGFEELFEVPCGGEDTDLERRFRLRGLRSRSVKHAAVCYHLHHPLLPRDGKADALCNDLAKQKTIRARVGLSEHALQTGQPK